MIFLRKLDILFIRLNKLFNVDLMSIQFSSHEEKRQSLEKIFRIQLSYTLYKINSKTKSDDLLEIYYQSNFFKILSNCDLTSIK